MRTPTPAQPTPAQRVLRKDASFWSEDVHVQAQIRNRLGWLDAMVFSREHEDRLQAFVRDVRQQGFRQILLLGMGGSFLAPEVFARIGGSVPGYPDLVTLDSTNPARILEIRANIDPQHTLVVVSSKSGDTIETMSLYRYFMHEYRRSGLKNPAGHFVAITDSDSALHIESEDTGFYGCFLNDPAIGGRYSALSLFGLLPAALVGVDVPAVLDCADGARDACIQGQGEGERLGQWLAAGWHAGCDKLAMVLPDEYEAFGWWVEQLVAESLGKDGKGILPYRAVDMERATRPDELCIDWTSSERTNEDADRLRRQEISDVTDLGRLFFHWEFATALAGGLLGINPFDEPDVAEAKRKTAVILKRGKLQEYLSSMDSADDIWTFLNGTGKGGYVAILAYTSQQSDAMSAQLEGFRRETARLVDVPVTLAPGPRYLHSVGQYHKGGPDTGSFLIIVNDDHPALPVPGSTYNFGTLISAQAIGDYQALRGAGRRVMLITEAAIPRLDSGK